MSLMEDLVREIEALKAKMNNLEVWGTPIVQNKTYTVSWTATITNPAIGNGTLVGRYTLIGKRCFLDIILTMGTTTTYGSGDWLFSLPFPVASGGTVSYIGVAHLRDAGVNNYERHVQLLPASTAITYFIQLDNATNVNNISATVPFTWGSGDVIIISINYEI